MIVLSLLISLDYEMTVLVLPFKEQRLKGWQLRHGRRM